MGEHCFKELAVNHNFLGTLPRFESSRFDFNLELPSDFRDLALRYTQRFFLFFLAPADVPCLKMLLSKILSFGVVAGSLVYKLPQILKVQNSRSAKGLAMLGVLLELLSYFFFPLLLPSSSIRACRTFYMFCFLLLFGTSHGGANGSPYNNHNNRVTISFSYSYSKGFPFMTYGESVFVAGASTALPSPIPLSSSSSSCTF